MSAPRRPRSSSHQGLRPELVDAVATLLAQARSVLFITGGGLAADAGLPLYRGIAGLGRRRADEGPLIEAALSPAGLARDPATTWKRLLAMDAAIAAATPSRGHEVLAALAQRIPRCVTMTQNVDRLERLAGLRDVIELHGALHELRCARCDVRIDVRGLAELPIPPGCATCRRALRPTMVLFGEALPEAPFTRLQEELDRGFDLVLAIGLPALPTYLARPLLLAKAEGVPTVEIGATPTELSELVDFRFRATPSRVLARLWDVYAQLARRRTIVGH